MLNKKAIIIFGIILILGSGGFFWWQNREIKGSPDDYVIRETEQGTIVENKKAGLTIRVPEGWMVEKMEAGEGGVTFYSKKEEMELENNQIVLPLGIGCVIGNEMVYKKVDFEELENEARTTHIMLNAKSDDFEEVVINSNKALKNIFELQKYGWGMGIYIPVASKVYTFYLYWAPTERENCTQKFDKFLETVSIQ